MPELAAPSIFRDKSVCKFMPTYEYECLKCGKNFDVFQSMKAEKFKTCPQAQCQVSPWGEGEVKRLLGTGAGLIFKGSGFYITDYRSDGYKQAAKKESGGGEPKTAKTSAPSEKSTAPSAPSKAGESSSASGTKNHSSSSGGGKSKGEAS